jgi:cell division protein FtsZ
MSNSNEFGSITFDLPKNQSNVIKVIGVGGGGGNAINHMYKAGIIGVDFIICNTDSQALDNSGVPNKIQLGVSLTEGLGAGANPEVGEQSAIESMEEIKNMLGTNTKMVFITAGMGGGTGTGAAPMIAKQARELDILTVGIVTIPFVFEGQMRTKQAQAGIEKLRKNVDSLIVINNNKLREVYGNLGFKAGFSKADEVLATAARGIAEVITHHYTQNIDLRDAKTVLSNSGTAIMGSATASGASRANEAIMKALDSPLLNDNKINDHIQGEAGHGANIIMGVGEDEKLGEAIAVTVIATGFNIDQQDTIVNTESKKIIHTLEDGQKAEQHLMGSENVLFKLIEDEEVPAVKNMVTTVENEQPPVIKHVLELEKSIMDLIPTSSYIKNFNVFYEEVIADKIGDDFIIVDAKSKTNNIIDPITVTSAKIEDDQFLFSFDMPEKLAVELKEEKENVFLFSLDDEVKEIEVKEYIEVIPVLEYNKEGEKRYSLDDYMELENKLTGATSKAENFNLKMVDDELFFESKTIEKPVSKITHDLDVDPVDMPLEELLKNRSEERRRKLKDFNYKFQNNNSSNRIDEIEKHPAYKRQGISLNEVDRNSKISRTSLSEDSNDEIQIRTNNSFLHDNVD